MNTKDIERVAFQAAKYALNVASLSDLQESASSTLNWMSENWNWRTRW